MTVRTLLAVGAGTFFALLVAAFATTVLLLGDESGGARAVGLTHRQGLLSQKVAKEALAYAGQPNPATLAELRNTLQVFSVTQRALRFGGSAPLDLQGLKFAEVSGAKDPEVQRLLQEASLTWDKVVDAIERLITAAQLRSEALTLVEVKNTRLARKLEDIGQVLVRRRQLSASHAAGLQGMMAERTVKEALLYDLNPNAKRQQRVRDAITEFEEGYASLRSKRLWLNDETDRLRLRFEVGEKLDDANWLWLDQSEALSAIGNTQYHRAVQAITESSPKLLATLGAAALRADQAVALNLRSLRQFQLLLLALGVILAIAAVVTSFRIGSSLRRLRDIADKVSRGQVDSKVDVEGFGEIRDLSKSFERMRRSLSKAMELVERATASSFPRGPAGRSRDDRRGGGER